MADGPVLGKTFVEFLPDVSKLEPAFRETEKRAQEAGKKTEAALSGAMSHASSAHAAEVQKMGLTWKQFITERMGDYMRMTGSHGAAMKLLGEEWRKYKATGTSAAAAVAAGTHATSAAVHGLSGKISMARVESILLRGAIGELIGHGTSGKLAHYFAESALHAEAASGATTALSGSLVSILAPAAGAAAAIAGVYAALKINDTGELEIIQSWFTKVGHAIRTGIRAGLRVAISGGQNESQKAKDYDLLADLLGLGENVQLPSDILSAAGKRPQTASKAAELAAIAAERTTLTLELQRATIENNSAAVIKLGSQMAILAEREALLNGTGEIHARTVRKLTIANLEAADAVERKRKAQEAELALQRELNKEFEEALRIGTYKNVNPSILTPGNTIQNLAARGEFAKSYSPSASRVEEVSVINTSAEIKKLEMQYISLGQVQVETLRQLSAEYAKSAMTMKDVYAGAIYSTETLFSDVLFAGVTGHLDQIDDAFKNFFHNLQRQIVNFLAQQAVKTLLMTFLGGGAAQMGKGTSFWSAFGQNWSYNMSTASYGHANGGILEGGFRAFAGGGIVTQPTLGLVGEGRYNEAVIPLPDGKHVEAKVTGPAAAIHQTIMLVQDPPPDMSDGRIITVVRAAMLRNGPLRQTVMDVAR